MFVIRCLVPFQSSLSLEAVADKVSAFVFGGMPFVATDEFDEVPGVVLRNEVFKLRIRIHGFKPQYVFAFESSMPVLDPRYLPNLHLVDLSEYVGWVLRQIPDISLESD